MIQILWYKALQILTLFLSWEKKQALSAFRSAFAYEMGKQVGKLVKNLPCTGINWDGNPMLLWHKDCWFFCTKCLSLWEVILKKTKQNKTTNKQTNKIKEEKKISHVMFSDQLSWSGYSRRAHTKCPLGQCCCPSSPAARVRQQQQGVATHRTMPGSREVRSVSLRIPFSVWICLPPPRRSIQYNYILCKEILFSPILHWPASFIK